jgi:predicted HicB family RNase H-like nuclease
MTYKGYEARIDFDSRDEIFVGRVLDLVDSITFHGSTVNELTSDFHAAIDQYLEDCDATGREPERPRTAKSER